MALMFGLAKLHGHLDNLMGKYFCLMSVECKIFRIIDVKG